MTPKRRLEREICKLLVLKYLPMMIPNSDSGGFVILFGCDYCGQAPRLI